MTTSSPAPTFWRSATTADKVAEINRLFSINTGRLAAAAKLGTSLHSLNGFCFRNRKKIKAQHRRARYAPNSMWAELKTAEARVAAITEMRKRDMSFGEIGHVLGVSHKTICALALPNAIDLPGRKITRGPRLPVHPLPPPETWLPLDGRAAAQEGGGCQWPIEVDDVRQGCCGLAVHKKSYCERHYAVSYRVGVLA